MTNSDDDSTNGTQFQAGPLIISAVMVGAGTLVALAGLTVGATYVIAVTRRRIQEMEVPPSELARMKWTQAKAIRVPAPTSTALMMSGAAWNCVPFVLSSLVLMVPSLKGRCYRYSGPSDECRHGRWPGRPGPRSAPLVLLCGQTGGDSAPQAGP